MNVNTYESEYAVKGMGILQWQEITKIERRGFFFSEIMNYFYETKFPVCHSPFFNSSPRDVVIDFRESGR